MATRIHPSQAQEVTLRRFMSDGVTVHSQRKCALICRDSGSYSIIWPDGSMQAYVGGLAVARAEIDAS